MKSKFTEESSWLCLNDLKNTAASLGVSNLANYVLDNKKFRIWSASSKPSQHHYGDYGLVHHTHEVTTSSLAMAEMYPQYEIDHRALFLSCIFHDFGKTEDYEKAEEQTIVDGDLTTVIGTYWKPTLHKRRIHHITASVLAWDRAFQSICKDIDKDTDGWTEEQIEEDNIFLKGLHEDVTHAILSHHGRREWGSPVCPNTRIAWLLHLCDGISARLEDCDRLDRLT